MFSFLRRLQLVFVLIGVILLVELRTDGFRTPKIIAHFDLDSKFYITKESEKEREVAKKILEQNFTYLNRGRQFFVFESEDGNYVLKFLNQENFSYPTILKTISFIPYVEDIIKRKDQKYLLTFFSMKLSFEQLKKETAILYVNLHKNEKLNKTVKIINKFGVQFDLDLDSTFFVLQKKARPFFPSLEKIYKTKNAVGLEMMIDSYLNLVAQRCFKCVADDDFNIKNNIGLCGDNPMIMDNGRLYLDKSLEDKSCFRKELLRSTKKLREWLSQKYPEEEPFLDRKIKEYVDK